MKNRITKLFAICLCAFSIGGCKKTYDGQDKATNDELVASELKELKVEKAPDKVEYVVGEYFDDRGMELRATFANKVTFLVPREQYSFNFEPLTLEDTTITITYKTKTVDVNISVSEAQAS